MQKFGEMCIAIYRDNTHQAKLANQGTPGIWVSYAGGHPTGTYWVFNPKTKKITLTSDVTFLQMSHGEYSKLEKPILVAISYEGSSDEEELRTVPIISKSNNNNLNTNSEINDDNENVFDEDINDESKQPPRPISMPKLFVQFKKFQVSYNDNANKIGKLHKKKIPSKI